MTPLIEKSQTLSPKKKQRPMRMEQQLQRSLSQEKRIRRSRVNSNDVEQLQLNI